jgi:hypothetical protein
VKRLRQRPLPHRTFTAFLAALFGVLPVVSALHMAEVPHIYSPEHRHFHEIVIVEEGGALDGHAASIEPLPSDATNHLRSLHVRVGLYQIDCPLANVTLRNCLLVGGEILLSEPAPLASRHDQPPLLPSHAARVIALAPKHSPPLAGS